MSLKDHLAILNHHAYVLIGGADTREELISILEKKHKIRAQGNPDFFDRSYTTFTIDDAREVKSSAGMRPVHSSAKKIFVLTMSSITVEAQNALLKLLEEPPEYAHFFLILPSAHLLLPTVKSRVSIIGGESGKVQGEKNNPDVMKEAEAFLKMQPAKRLDTVKALMESISKEKRAKQDAVELLDAIQAAVYSKKGIKEGKQALEAIETARKYATDRAPSLKMLLEYVALNV